MACTAVFACVHVSHSNFISAFLHLENLGVAVIALQALVCMCLAVKYDLAGIYRLHIQRSFQEELQKHCQQMQLQ